MLIDFRASSIEWCTKENSTGVFSLESVLKTKNKIWALGSKVKACNVYSKDSLFRIPAYDFQPLFSEDVCRIYRTYSDHKTDDSQSRSNELFNYHKLNFIYKKEMKVCHPKEILNFSLQCQIKYEDQELQFPVKHLNRNNSGEFQVETGPVAFQLKNEIVISSIAFNKLNEFELLIENDALNKREQQIIKYRNCEINLYTDI